MGLLAWWGGRWIQTPEQSLVAALCLTTLVLVPAIVSFYAYPAHHAARPLLIVAISSGIYLFSTRVFVAVNALIVVLWCLTWLSSGYAINAEDVVLSLVAAPALGYVFCSSQLTVLRREFGLQQESLRREEALASALEHITLEQARRQEAEELRRSGEERLKAQQAQLFHVSRLSAMGEMVAGIAHEINQPLQALATYAGVLEVLAESPEQPLPETARAAAGHINELAQRCGAIIRRLQKFTKRAEHQFDVLSLHPLLDEAVALTANEAQRSGVQVRYDYCSDHVRVRADAIQLQQVLVNLLRNAYESMASVPPADRVVTLATRRVDDGVVITVADCGTGIQPHDETEIFNAFFSTKPTGMGMGLAISQSILEVHHGSITVESTSPHGTTFAIRLPIAEVSHE